MHKGTTTHSPFSVISVALSLMLVTTPLDEPVTEAP